MWPPGKLLSKSGNGDCCRRFSCSGRRRTFKLGVPHPSPGLGLSLPRGTPVSSHPKEPLLWDTPLQGSYKRNKRSAQGLGVMPPRTAGKHRDISSREKRPLPWDSKACLIKTRAGCELERRANGASTRGRLTHLPTQGRLKGQGSLSSGRGISSTREICEQQLNNQLSGARGPVLTSEHLLILKF